MGNASVKLIMRPSKRRADGAVQVYLRAIYARQSKEAATGIWVEPKAWDGGRGRVRKSHPLAVPYNARLEDLLLKARAAATRARSAADVIAALDGRAGSLSAFLRDHVADLEAAGAYWERKKYATTARKLHAALGQPWPGGSLPWEALTLASLDRFARYCRETCGNGPNTVRKELVRLRTVCNRAVRAGALRPELDPFLRYSPPKGQPVTRRRLSFDEIVALAALDLKTGTHPRVVRDAFLLSYYGAGIRVSDVLRLTRVNVVDGQGRPVDLSSSTPTEVRIDYRMQKTGMPISVKLPPVAVELLRPYVLTALPGRYLFPLLKRGDDADPVELRKRQASATAMANAVLKKLGEAAGIGGDGLSQHAARHSWADHARRVGDLYAVSKSLGHKNLQTTQAYLSSFDRAAVDGLTDALWG